MKRFRDILCVVEPGDTSKDALSRAVALAQNNQAGLTVVSVADTVKAGFGMPKGGPISADLQVALVNMHEQGLEALFEAYRKQIPIETKVLVGVPYLEVVRQVLRNGHDLVIKMPENPEWLDRLFGSDDMHLMRKCPCPVWMIKPQSATSYRCILAAVDADNDHPPAELQTRHALNLQVLEMASSLALSEFAQLHIVNVWDAIGESAMRGAFMHMPEEKIIAYLEEVRSQHAASMDDLIHEVTGKLGQAAVGYLEPQIHLLKGWARKEVPALATKIEADLVVMGTVGRTGIPGVFMGNTAETILNQLDCSVLAVKPPGFVTPVTLVD